MMLLMLNLFLHRVVEYKARKKWKFPERVKALIEELEIACPESGSRNWTEVRQFNLMFGTKLEHQQIQQWTCICVQKRHRYFVNFERTKIRRMKVLWYCSNRKSI
jgi:glycyl-tRNA synthetase (class II)